MPRDLDRADAPDRWLANAQADLALAKVSLPPDGLFEHLCFHAQQAAEKSIKAVLLKCRIDFPYTHNLQTLLSLLPTGIAPGLDLREAVGLTPYAISTQYPGEMEPTTEEEYRAAVRVAETVVNWAESILR
jgi:HEPN domain-containing protein